MLTVLYCNYLIRKMEHTILGASFSTVFNSGCVIYPDSEMHRDSLVRLPRCAAMRGSEH